MRINSLGFVVLFVGVLALPVGCGGGATGQAGITKPQITISHDAPIDGVIAV